MNQNAREMEDALQLQRRDEQEALRLLARVLGYDPNDYDLYTVCLLYAKKRLENYFEDLSGFIDYMRKIDLE